MGGVSKLLLAPWYLPKQENSMTRVLARRPVDLTKLNPGPNFDGWHSGVATSLEARAPRFTYAGYFPRWISDILL
jgi:hypothetical protein